MADGENWGDDPVLMETDSTLPNQPAELPEIKLFGRWSCDDVQVSDMSLQVCCMWIKRISCNLDIHVLF